MDEDDDETFPNYIVNMEIKTGPVESFKKQTVDHQSFKVER